MKFTNSQITGHNYFGQRRHHRVPEDVFPLAQALLKLIRVTYHVQHFAYGAIPKGFKKQTEKLMSFVKPAYANNDAQKQLDIISKKWAVDICEEMKNHYLAEAQSIVTDFLPSWFDISLNSFGIAWKAAIYWSKNTHKKLPDNIFIHLFDNIKDNFPNLENMEWNFFEEQSFTFPNGSKYEDHGSDSCNIDTDNLHSSGSQDTSTPEHDTKRKAVLCAANPTSVQTHFSRQFSQSKKTPEGAGHNPVKSPDSKCDTKNLSCRTDSSFYSTDDMHRLEEKLADLVQLNMQHEELFHRHKETLQSLQHLFPSMFFTCS